MTESLRLGAGDIMVFLCAIAFAIQIMTVDHYAARIDGAVVSCIQFTVCGVVCCIGALIWGQPTFGQLQEGLGALLYAGVLSCGVGSVSYTHLLRRGGRDRLPVPAMDDSGFCGHDGSGGPDLYSAVETEPS